MAVSEASRRRPWSRRLGIAVAICAALVAAGLLGYRMTPKQRMLRGINRIDMPPTLHLESGEIRQCFICWMGDENYVTRYYSATGSLDETRQGMDAAMTEAGFRRAEPAGAPNIWGGKAETYDRWEGHDLTVSVSVEGVEGGSQWDVSVIGRY
jgi:hypothetical protein